MRDYLGNGGNMEKQQRNWRFDYLKGLSCIIVILLHCPIPGVVGEAIIYACRFSVPIFFMITGYYTESKDNRWIICKGRQLLVKLLIAEVLYGMWKLFVHAVLDGKPVYDYFENFYYTKNPVIIFFCGSLFNGVFWYIYAMLWAYVLVLILRKLKWIYNKLFCIISTGILVVVQVVGRFIMQNSTDINNYTFLFRNALVFALPMMLLGMLFSRYEKVIKERISPGKNILILIVGLVVLIFEYIFSRQYMDFHFSTLIISSSLFIFAFVYDKKEIIFKKPISFTGKSLSLWIYLDHMFFDQLLERISLSLGLSQNKIYKYMHPFIVIICSILLALLIYYVKRLRYRKKGNR